MLVVLSVSERFFNVIFRTTFQTCKIDNSFLIASVVFRISNMISHKEREIGENQCLHSEVMYGSVLEHYKGTLLGLAIVPAYRVLLQEAYSESVLTALLRRDLRGRLASRPPWHHQEI